MNIEKRYLGDSVYAEIENGMVKLTTNNGYPDDPRNVIYLETSVFHLLTQFYRDALKHYSHARKSQEVEEE